MEIELLENLVFYSATTSLRLCLQQNESGIAYIIFMLF